jgi:glutamine amidotransferase
MSGGQNEVQATFWLVDAPDSLLLQSESQPDGVGLGTFEPDGTPRPWRKPVAANRSETFVRGAQQVRSRTFLAHIRHATAAAPTYENTHPFEQHGRLFAHNGVLGDLDGLRARLGEHAALLKGATDSELYFTLMTKRIEEHGGDVAAGITAAASEIAAELPLYSLNMILTTPTDLWALRYPDTNELWILERTMGNLGGGEMGADSGITRVFSGQLAILPATVIASEPMDSSAGWRRLESGELIHVDPELRISSSIVVPDPPANLMELTAKEAVAQEEDTPRSASRTLRVPPASNPG